MHEKPLIGVSRCLLGDAVRYDGDSKASIIVIERLGDLFELAPVCPEVEAGLAVPRPPVQLTGSIEHPRLTGRKDPRLDVTELMLNYCNSRPVDLDHLSGFVFKSRSPSCGLNSTPVFINGACVTETGSGLFARAMAAMYPGLPAIEDDELELASKYQQFIDEVYQYMRPK
jgi:uncharacterized protein YbbK (DUF523 family)